jgi:phage host-nuclease inhibitor protein Gam
MTEPLTAEELRRLRSDTEAGYTAKAPTVAALLATIDDLEAEAERLRARLSDAERNLEDAGRWANQARNLCASIVGMADAYKSYSALAGTGAESVLRQ